MNIQTIKTTSVDFSGLSFYVGHSDLFDAADFAEYVGVALEDLDPQEVKMVQDQVSRLNEGEYLEVVFN